MSARTDAALSTATLDEILSQVPPGFRIVRNEDGCVELVFRRIDRAAYDAKLLALTVLLAIGLLLATRDLIVHGIDVPAVPRLAALFAADIVLGAISLYLYFGRRRLRFEPDRLTIETNVFGLRTRRVLPRSQFQKVGLWQHQSDNRGARIGWDLTLISITHPDTRLIFRQPYSSGYWLGRFVARWFNLRFDAEPPPEDREGVMDEVVF